MKRLFKKLGKSKKLKDPLLIITDAPGLNLAPGTSTSTFVSSTADPMPSVLAPASVQATGVTTALGLGVSASASAIDDLAPVVYTHENLNNNFPSSSGAMVQANVASMESELQRPFSNLGLLGSAQNILITGGNFNFINILPANKTKIPLLQPNSSPFFTGRRDVLDKIRKIFADCANSQPVLRSSCLLWGMGGIGKTQICLKFIEEMSDSFSYVFWIDASSEENINMSLKGISGISAAQNFGVDDSVESVLHWISSIQGWLIVFDNADDPPSHVVAKYIPSGKRGSILITSRNRSMGRIVSFENSIEINEMEEADAVTLLLKTSFLDSSAEHLNAAKRIVNELGCIPLAVDHAGAYIEAGKCDINDYLRKLSMHRQTLMSDASFRGASNYDRTVYGTWDLSFREIEKRAGGQLTTENGQAAKAAILVLQICAFYHHSYIPTEIFQSAAEKCGKDDVIGGLAEKLPQAITSLDYTLLSLDNDGHWDDLIFREGLAILLSFSLVKRGQSSAIFSIHPLVHCWSREQMSKCEQQRMYEIGSTILCCAISWEGTSQDYTLHRLIFPHIKANELYKWQLGIVMQYYDDKCYNFALVMSNNGDWKNAEQLQIQVMEMRKKLLGVEHPYTLSSMGTLASTYKNQGKLNEAEQLEIQVIEMRKKVFGKEHPATLSGMGNLASTYKNKGKLNEAEQLEIQVMEMRKKVLGAEHPDTLSCMGNLATTYLEQGKLNEAEQLDIQVMEMRKKVLGVEHPDTLLSMANLASTYRNQGKLNEAENLEIQVMEIRKKVLGAENPDTLLSMGNLASTYWNQGKLNEAEQLEIQVMEMRKKVLGEEHPDTLLSMGNLASTYWKQGKLNEAEQLEIQVIEVRKKVLGEEHPDTLLSMGNLASTYWKQGKLSEAEQLEIQVIEMRKKVFGEEHPATLLSMGNLASTYWKQGRLNEAEQLQIQVMEMWKKVFGAEHPDTLLSMQNLAYTYYSQGRWNEAEQLRVEVMTIRKGLNALEIKHIAQE